MSSLHELLSEEGFERAKSSTTTRSSTNHQTKKVKFRERIKPEESITLPIYICHDLKSLDFSKNHRPDKAFIRNGSSLFSSKRSNPISIPEGCLRRNEPAIDEVAIRAVVSILTGYVGRYLKDDIFRESVREKCYSCLATRKDEDFDDGIFTNLELGIESVEKLVESLSQEDCTEKELRLKALQNSISLLSIVSSLNSKKTPNSDLSACAQLYLSIVYKLEKNDRISAKHILQVFCDSPFIARTRLLPELWDHFFLPHLLHLKVWYSKELEFLSNSEYGDKEKKMKALGKIYNEKMNNGTSQFAVYYKEWLKVGGQAPPIPTVPLPSRPSYGQSRRQSLDSSVSHSSTSKSLFRAVFGPTFERRSMDIQDRISPSQNPWGLDEDEKIKNGTTHRRSLSQINRKSKDESLVETQKSDYLRFLTCQSEPVESFVHLNHLGSNGSMRKLDNTHFPSTDLSKSIATICSSDILNDCEASIRVITKAWLDSNGDPSVAKYLSKAAVIEGILEVLNASNDDEILELAISILAEFASRNEANRHVILNSDPQLDIFTRLLRSSSLFLKAAVLLYLVKPKAKQMISMEWIPLVLRVLEFGDQLPTLFTIQCSPQLAAYYFLDELLNGFDEDRNLENARQVVTIGGLNLLVKRMAVGDVCEKNNAASIISCCIRAEGSCRHYLAKNLNLGCVLELLVLGKQRSCQWHAMDLLTELLCINRTRATNVLNQVISGCGSLNAMHILLVYLQKAPLEERPIVAAILLQLDLLGDPLRSSVYREEAVEEIIAALDCQICNEKVQTQSARALMFLVGRFSYTGNATAEKWLLKEAGFSYETSGTPARGKDSIVDEFLHSNEENDAMDIWQRKSALVLLTSGKKKLVCALLGCIENGIPILARSSLVTLSWMCSFLHSIGDRDLQSMANSVLVPHFIQLLNYDRSLEERVLASFSLLNLINISDCKSRISSNKEVMGSLRNLSKVTWTATQLISIITTRSSH